MQSSTGQYSTHAGDPAQPVQHSVMTASSLGFFLRGVVKPLERGSCFSSSGTSPTVLETGDVVMGRDYTVRGALCKSTRWSDLGLRSNAIPLVFGAHAELQQSEVGAIAGHFVSFSIAWYNR